MNRITQRLLVVLLATGLAVEGTGCAKKTETADTTTSTEEVRVTSETWDAVSAPTSASRTRPTRSARATPFTSR